MSIISLVVKDQPGIDQFLVERIEKLEALGHTVDVVLLDKDSSLAIIDLANAVPLFNFLGKKQSKSITKWEQVRL